MILICEIHSNGSCPEPRLELTSSWSSKLVHGEYVYMWLGSITANSRLNNDLKRYVQSYPIVRQIGFNKAWQHTKNSFRYLKQSLLIKLLLITL